MRTEQSGAYDQTLNRPRMSLSKLFATQCVPCGLRRKTHVSCTHSATVTQTLRWTSKAHMSEMGAMTLASFVEETEADASDPRTPSQNDQDAATEDV